MRTMACAATFGIFIAAAQAAQIPQGAGVKDRGRTAVQDETQTVDRGRLGKQYPVPRNPFVMRGILVDAGCVDRSSLNLRQPPRPPAIAPSVPSSGKGATPAGAGDPARADALEHQVPDLVARQNDPTCAVTALTRGFALLTTSGRLLNLDEGGNTMAIQAIQGNAAGRALLSGAGPAIKPQAAVTGRIWGDRLLTDTLSIE